jgi:hypothetical protein
MGLYDTPTAHATRVVFQGKISAACRFLSQLVSLQMPVDVLLFSVQLRSQTLLPLYGVEGSIWTGHLSWVRVVPTTSGQRKIPVILFYGKIESLLMDPGRLMWRDKSPFMSYTTQKGCTLLRNPHPPLQLVGDKWALVLPVDFKFNWNRVWSAERARKEANLIWQLWHRAIEVNMWRGKISAHIDRSCPMCDTGKEESVVHKFWSCESAQILWRFTTDFLHKLAAPVTSR